MFHTWTASSSWIALFSWVSLNVSLLHGLWSLCSYLQLGLCYLVVISTRHCCSLLFESYLIGFMDSFVNVLCMSRLHFCGSNIIYHFFRKEPPLLALSFTDIHDIEIIISIFAGSTLLVSFIIVSASYVAILSIILKITSTSGKQNTCRSLNMYEACSQSVGICFLYICHLI